MGNRELTTMDLKQLEVFVQVVKLKSFSKAAESLHLSQPTISSHIATLEHALGVQLLIRSTKAINPTKAGLRFLHYAQSMLALRDEALDSVHESDSDYSGDVFITASSVPAQFILPKVVAEFHVQYPQVTLHVSQGDSESVQYDLESPLIDFGIIGTEKESGNLTQMVLCKDTLAIIYPNGFAESEEWVDAHTSEFLTDKPFVMRETGSGTLAETTKYLASIGLTLGDLHASCYFGDTMGIMNAVANGAGVSIVSKVAAETFALSGSLRMVEVDEAVFSRNFYLLKRKKKLFTPAQKAFESFLCCSL